MKTSITLYIDVENKAEAEAIMQKIRTALIADTSAVVSGNVIEKI